MRLPRDLDGDDLVKALRLCGYELTRQTGSHMRLTTSVNGEHHGETRDELAARIFK